MPLQQLLLLKALRNGLRGDVLDAGVVADAAERFVGRCWRFG
jgi:hypothetical protein